MQTFVEQRDGSRLLKKWPSAKKTKGFLGYLNVSLRKKWDLEAIMEAHFL
jgi:hypothetical protein